MSLGLPDVDPWPAISRPTLIVDKVRSINNISRMMRKATDSRVRFRPHFKTHSSPAIGRWFRELGVEAITVSSVEMARLFANAGWQDITIAFPLNIRALGEIERLAQEVHLGLLVDSVESALAIASLRATVSVWIDVDVGYGRTGVPWNDHRELTRVFHAVSGSRRQAVRGVLTHAGHVYDAKSRRAVRRIHHQSIERMGAARDFLASSWGAVLEVSVGDTPTCDLATDFDGVDEVRPGNFVFHDLQQLALGACSAADLALAVACPVVGVYPGRREIVVQGGSVHLSRDCAPGPGGEPSYGRLAAFTGTSWDLLPAGCFVRSLSQEHGVVRVIRRFMSSVRPGDLVLIVPAHACLAANLIRDCVTIDGGAVR
jgi:D-serine deaminase-like pyridoxal phosphate-dependent protein